MFFLALLVISFLAVSVLFLKLYIVLTTRWTHSPVCLIGKTVLVTGSNVGIGYYTALDFAKRGARVILACRNKTKGDAARAQLIEATGNRNILVKFLDLSSLKSVRKFAKSVYETEERLDILVNNAGAGSFEHSYTADGLSLTMQTNHFGPFLLTILLIGLLKKSAPSRIVNVASKAAIIGKLNFENLNDPSRFSTLTDYSNSKLCNLLFTIKLAHELKGTGVTANVVHPGVVQSDILKDSSILFSKIMRIFMALTYMSTEAGAQTSVHVAIVKELDGVSGKFFVDCAETAYPQSARDITVANKLWDKSKEFVNLTAEEEIDLLS